MIMIGFLPGKGELMVVCHWLPLDGDDILRSGPTVERGLQIICDLNGNRPGEHLTQASES